MKHCVRGIKYTVHIINPICVDSKMDLQIVPAPQNEATIFNVKAEKVGAMSAKADRGVPIYSAQRGREIPIPT